MCEEGGEMIDLISVLIGIVLGQTCGILMSTISLEKAEKRADENYEKYLEKEKRYARDKI